MRNLFRRMWAISLAWPLVTMLAVGGIGTACTDTIYDTLTVEVPGPRPPLNQAADSVHGLLGYYALGEGQTTCGQCHAGTQAEWAGTKHSQAWEDLQASGGAQSFCEPCHTVNEYGNALAETAGYSLVKDSSYFDVQCESCHGPGRDHVADPPGTFPLPSIAVDSILDAPTNGCGECHVGEHHPFVEQWAESKHGYGGEAYIDEGGRATCAPCHEGRTAITAKMGGSTRFLEYGVAGAAAYQPIVCAVCHDPHDPTNQGQLRRSMSVPTRDNLCVSCHSREGVPATSGVSRRGPHAAQGLLVIDEDVGWLPPGFQYDTGNINGSHGTAANPRLCASCHVQFKTINDASGNFMLNSVGHLFEAIPCVDANGQPVPGSCAEDQRDFSACAVSGCHGSVDGAKIAFDVVKDRLNGLTDALWKDDGDSIMETTDTGLLPKILAQAIAANNREVMNLYRRPLTPAEGAIWNAQLAATDDRAHWMSFKIAGQNSCGNPANCTYGDSVNTAHRSSGEGAHNPFLLEALLLSSINYLQTYYNVTAPPVELTPQLKAPPGLRTE